MKQKTTKQKLARLLVISTLCKQQRRRIGNANERIAEFHSETVKLIRSIPASDLEIYAEKIAKYACA